MLLFCLSRKIIFHVALSIFIAQPSAQLVLLFLSHLAIMQPEGVQFFKFLLAMFLYFIFELNSLSIEVIRGYVFLGLGHS